MVVRRTCGPNLLVQGGLVLLQPLLALFDGAAVLAILLGRIIQLGVSLSLSRRGRSSVGGEVYLRG